jgi:hypothetical protein
MTHFVKNVTFLLKKTLYKDFYTGFSLFFLI